LERLITWLGIIRVLPMLMRLVLSLREKERAGPYVAPPPTLITAERGLSMRTTEAEVEPEAAALGAPAEAPSSGEAAAPAPSALGIRRAGTAR
jgi:hypothetical protein